MDHTRANIHRHLTQEKFGADVFAMERIHHADVVDVFYGLSLNKIRSSSDYGIAD